MSAATEVKYRWVADNPQDLMTKARWLISKGRP